MNYTAKYGGHTQLNKNRVNKVNLYQVSAWENQQQFIFKQKSTYEKKNRSQVTIIASFECMIEHSNENLELKINSRYDKQF